MKQIWLSLGLLVAASPVGATDCKGALEPGTLICRLVSGDRVGLATIDLGGPGEKMRDSADDPASTHHDLSFLLEVSCEGAECRAVVTLSSESLEDEAGQKVFRWPKDQRGEVVSEPVTNAPDGRAYHLSCVVE